MSTLCRQYRQGGTDLKQKVLILPARASAGLLWAPACHTRVVETNPVKRLSATLFGARHLLDIAYVVASSEDGIVYATEVAFTLRGVSASQVGQTLNKLAEAGLMERIDPARWERRVLFRRIESPFWDYVREQVGDLTVRGILDEGDTQ